MTIRKELLQELAATLAGMPLTDEQAAALAAVHGAAVQNLARYPDAALVNVEPPVWFRPLPAHREG